MRIRTSFTEMTINALLLFSVFTVLQGIPFLQNINKLWLILSVAILTIDLSRCRYNKFDVTAIFLAVILHIAALFFTRFPIENGNVLFYFALWVMVYLFFDKRKAKVLKLLEIRNQYINALLWLWTLIVGVSAFFPSSYIDNYFISFTESSFRLMPTVLIITAISMYMSISRNNRIYEFFLIVPTYSAFMNQSRTYFGVYFIFLLMYMYMRFRSKKAFYIMLIPIVSMIVGIMTLSGIMDKIVATQYNEKSYFDFWGTITSGRTVFWKWDIEAFLALPFWQQFVGNGFNFVYDVNGANMSRIWAHNDIINLLMNFGYIGVAIYLWSYFKLTRTYMPKGANIPFPVRAMFHGAVFINSMMNMSYTYLCAMISYPLFLCAISARYDKIEQE